MMGRFLGQFGLSLAVAPIMPTDFFPVNFYQMLKRQTRKSLNEFYDRTYAVEPVKPSRKLDSSQKTLCNPSNSLQI